MASSTTTSISVILMSSDGYEILNSDGLSIYALPPLTIPSFSPLYVYQNLSLTTGMSTIYFFTFYLPSGLDSTS